MDDLQDLTRLSRRGLLVAGVGTISAQAFAGAATAKIDSTSTGHVKMVLLLNGRELSFNADVRTTLLDAVREKLGLTGTKKGCDHGQCGACTVHVDGKRTLACLTLAVAVQGKAVKTIEGLSQGNTLHPMQQAFIDHDAFQCGYCTPGQIMSAVALVEEGHSGSDEDIREYMSGNLCRCAAYPNIVAAINDAKAKMPPTVANRRA